MAIAMTDQQKDDLNRKGYFGVENVLGTEEDFKVGWHISDHTEPGHSTILVVPGSYKWSREQRTTFEDWLDPADIVAVKVPAGSVMLWRPPLLHSVTPNLSASCMSPPTRRKPSWKPSSAERGSSTPTSLTSARAERSRAPCREPEAAPWRLPSGSACLAPSCGSSRAERRCAARTRPASARGAAEPGGRNAPCPSSLRCRHDAAARRGQPPSLDRVPRDRPVPEEGFADRPDQPSRVFCSYSPSSLRFALRAENPDPGRIEECTDGVGEVEAPLRETAVALGIVPLKLDGLLVGQWPTSVNFRAR